MIFLIFVILPQNIKKTKKFIIYLEFYNIFVNYLENIISL